jgi:hypothetical protein
MAGLAAPLAGTKSATARWSTLAYVEKVRSQFLSLRFPCSAFDSRKSLNKVAPF